MLYPALQSSLAQHFEEEPDALADLQRPMANLEPLHLDETGLAQDSWNLENLMKEHGKKDGEISL